METGIPKRMITANIGKFGTMEVGLPILEIGTGEPKLSIICGIHGNETSALFVVQKLLRQISEFGAINGTIRILADSNPLAKISGERCCTVDSQDLNRVFPGDKTGSISQRIADGILGVIGDSDAVIDLHSFEMETPVMGILVNNANPKSCELLRVFSPKQAWVLNSNRFKEKHFGSSLGAVLAERGVPNFAAELNQHNLSDEDVDIAVTGILNVCSLFGILPSREIKAVNTFPLFDRSVIFAESSGIFCPSKKPFDSVKKGEVIGIVTAIDSFEEKAIMSSGEGIIMQISWKKVIMPGEELAAIGKEIK